MAVSLYDSVKVVNVAPPEHKYGKLTIFHGPRVQHTIESGEETYVPYYIAKNWFGDVRSGETTQGYVENTELGPRTAVIPTREFEVTRLHAHYGLHSGPSDTFDEKDVPQVELYDTEGNRLKTVLEDPSGKEVVEARVSVSQAEAQAETIRQLTQRLNKLEGLNDVEEPEQGQPDETLPTDDPETE